MLSRGADFPLPLSKAHASQTRSATEGSNLGEGLGKRAINKDSVIGNAVDGESCISAMAPRKTNHRIRGTTSDIDQAAQRLRKQSTPAEAKLWQALRNRKLNGLRFRRQHPVGRFILDFYCPSEKLVIEIDGSIHTQQEDYDAQRTEELEKYGYRVLRFTNEAVLNSLNTVLEEIYRATLQL